MNITERIRFVGSERVVVSWQTNSASPVLPHLAKRMTAREWYVLVPSIPKLPPETYVAVKNGCGESRCALDTILLKAFQKVIAIAIYYMRVYLVLELS